MKKLLLLFSFLASFMLGLTSCTDEPETTTGIISGTVTLGPDGIAPLEGVTVTLAELGHSKTTDQYGLFSFENVTPGVYTLKFYKAGYSTESRGVTVMRDDVSVCDLSMQPEETSESLTLSDFRLSFSKDITEKTFTIYNDGNSGTIN